MLYQLSYRSIVVGVAGIEPTTSCSQSKRLTTRLHPVSCPMKEWYADGLFEFAVPTFNDHTHIGLNVSVSQRVHYSAICNWQRLWTCRNGEVWICTTSLLLFASGCGTRIWTEMCGLWNHWVTITLFRIGAGGKWIKPPVVFLARIELASAPWKSAVLPLHHRNKVGGFYWIWLVINILGSYVK